MNARRLSHTHGTARANSTTAPMPVRYQPKTAKLRVSSQPTIQRIDVKAAAKATTRPNAGAATPKTRDHLGPAPERLVGGRHSQRHQPEQEAELDRRLHRAPDEEGGQDRHQPPADAGPEGDRLGEADHRRLADTHELQVELASTGPRTVPRAEDEEATGHPRHGDRNDAEQQRLHDGASQEAGDGGGSERHRQRDEDAVVAGTATDCALDELRGPVPIQHQNREDGPTLDADGVHLERSLRPAIHHRCRATETKPGGGRWTTRGGTP